LFTDVMVLSCCLNRVFSTTNEPICRHAAVRQRRMIWNPPLAVGIQDIMTTPNAARSPVMLPIPGTSKVKHLEENVATADLKLSEPEWESWEEAAKKAA
jgi:predicted oxidoreductase